MKGIIFDCDGVLVDSERAHFISWQKALEKRGIQWEEKKHYAFCGYPGDFIAQKFNELFKIDSAEALLADKRSHYRELQNNGIPAHARTMNLLRQLAANKHRLNIKLGLASGARKKEILINLSRNGVLEAFDAIVSGCDDLSHYNDPEGVNKPKPYIYLHTAHLLNLEPSQCAAVEDSRPGVLAASCSGMLTIAMPNQFSQEHDFSPAAYVIGVDDDIELDDFLRIAQIKDSVYDISRSTK